MADPEGFERLDGRERMLFRRWQGKSELIGRQEAEKHGSLNAAKPSIVARLRNECESIVATLLIGLLIKVAIEAAWQALKKLWPNTFSGPLPSDAFEGVEL